MCDTCKNRKLGGGTCHRFVTAFCAELVLRPHHPAVDKDICPSKLSVEADGRQHFLHVYDQLSPHMPYKICMNTYRPARQLSNCQNSDTSILTSWKFLSSLLWVPSTVEACSVWLLQIRSWEQHVPDHCTGCRGCEIQSVCRVHVLIFLHFKERTCKTTTWRGNDDGCHTVKLSFPDCFFFSQHCFVCLCLVRLQVITGCPITADTVINSTSTQYGDELLLWDSV